MSIVEIQTYHAFKWSLFFFISLYNAIADQLQKLNIQVLCITVIPFKYLSKSK